MRPTVAIVGRPNTGKSTLFNRILGSVSAITFGESGTTRDRVFGHSKIDEMSVVFVDTGGLELTKNNNDLESNIRKQTTIAIEESDLIILVVDASEELTASDFGAAQILRESGKKVVLVASKSDRFSIDDHFFNLYELGFGDPVKVSAIHNIGIDELEHRIIEDLVDLGFARDKEENIDEICIGFVGKPNVGKSSLINGLTGKDQVIVSQNPGTTRDAVHVSFEYDKINYRLIDTAGIRRSGKRRGQWIEKYGFLRSLRAIEESDISVLVIDAVEGITKQDMRVSQFILEAQKGLILVVNKCDLIDSDRKNDLLTELSEKMSYAHFAPVIFTSVIEGRNLLKIPERAKMIYDERQKKIKTGDLNLYLEKIVSGHPPPHGINIKFIRQADTSPPTFVVFANKPDNIHFSYKRYIENKIREQYDFTGTALNFVYKRK